MARRWPTHTRATTPNPNPKPKNPSHARGRQTSSRWQQRQLPMNSKETTDAHHSNSARRWVKQGEGGSSVHSVLPPSQRPSRSPSMRPAGPATTLDKEDRAVAMSPNLNSNSYQKGRAATAIAMAAADGTRAYRQSEAKLVVRKRRTEQQDSRQKQKNRAVATKPKKLASTEPKSSTFNPFYESFTL